MTDHCTLDQLIALRDAAAQTEPGSGEARAHLAECAVCRAEADRLEQRVARLKALPVLVPARDRFPELRARVATERRVRRIRWAGLSGLAAAAAVAGVLVGHGIFRSAAPAGTDPAAPNQQLAQVMAESRALEGELARLDPDNRAMDLTTAQVAGQLQTRIAAIDAQLQTAQLTGSVTPTNDQLIELWRERVGLMDALVDVHVTRASQVGL